MCSVCVCVTSSSLCVDACNRLFTRYSINMRSISGSGDVHSGENGPRTHCYQDLRSDQIVRTTPAGSHQDQISVQSDANQEPELQKTSSCPCCLQLCPSCRLKTPVNTSRRTPSSARTQKLDPINYSITFPKQIHQKAFREYWLWSIDLWSIRLSVVGQVALWGM